MLVYLNRSQLDLLRSPFAGMFRGALEDRLERNAPEVVRGLRAPRAAIRPNGHSARSRPYLTNR